MATLHVPTDRLSNVYYCSQTKPPEILLWVSALCHYHRLTITTPLPTSVRATLPLNLITYTR